MEKNEDPFNGMLKLLKKISEKNGIQKGTRIGVIVSPPPDIIISVDGMQVDKNNLWVDEYWVPGHTRYVVGETSDQSGGSGDAAFESHRHQIDNDEELTDTWKVGDHVQLDPIYSEDDKRSGQQFIVHCKLRRFDGNG